jgi:hypothetical protein
MQLDMTQTAFAALIGIDPRTVRAWVAGGRPMPLAAAIVLRLLARGPSCTFGPPVVQADVPHYQVTTGTAMAEEPGVTPPASFQLAGQAPATTGARITADPPRRPSPSRWFPCRSLRHAVYDNGKEFASHVENSTLVPERYKPRKMTPDHPGP